MNFLSKNKQNVSLIHIEYRLMCIILHKIDDIEPCCMLQLLKLISGSVDNPTQILANIRGKFSTQFYHHFIGIK